MSVSITQEVRVSVRLGQRFIGSFTRAELIELYCAINMELHAEQRHFDIDGIIAEVCNVFQVSRTQIMGKSRLDRIVFARHMAIKLVQEKCKLSSNDVGVIFGGLDHGTVLNATRRIKERRLYAPNAKIIQAIEAAIEAQCQQSIAALPAADRPGDAGTAPSAGANGNYFADAPHGVGLVERRETL